MARRKSNSERTIKAWGFRGFLMVGFGWWGCAKLWYNVRYEAVAQLQDQPVLPSDQPHCQLRETRPDRFQACDKCLALPRYGKQ